MPSYLSRFVLILLLGTLVVAQDKPGEPKPAEQQEQVPPAPTHFMGRRIAHTMHWIAADWLTRTTREREEGASLLIAELKKKVTPGMTVCDLGCGNGYYTLELAQMVGEKGKVYGVDIQPEMLKMLGERAKKAGVKNIQPVHNTLLSTKLPDVSCDLVLLVDVYHEFSHPQQMLDSIRKSLKPGGLAVLVEFRAEDDKVPIKEDHKMSKEQVLKEWPPSGFKLVEEFDKLPWQHVMYFQRDDSADKPAGTPQ